MRRHALPFLLLTTISSCHHGATEMLASLLEAPAAVRPRIVRSNPDPASGDYNAASDLFVEFDRPMDEKATERAFSITGSAAPGGSNRWDGNRLIHDLTAPLTHGLPYVLRVLGSARSREGNTMELEYMVHFISGSRIDAPIVLSSTPPRNAQGIDSSAQIILVFSRSMNRESVEKSLQISPATYGSFAWSGGDTVLTFTPYEGLTVPAGYSVSLSTSASDSEGISLASSFALSFQTGSDLTRPRVLGLSEEGALTSIVEDPALGYCDGIYKDASLWISFSEPMLPTETEGSVSLTRADDGSSVTVQTIWAPTFNRLIVRPIAPLEPETIFRLRLSTTAKDTSGNGLLNPFQRSFRVSNATGAINSSPLSLTDARLTLPHPEQTIDLSPNYTTVLHVEGSDIAATGAQATLQIDLSHSLAPGSVPGAITISKVIGGHPAAGRLFSVQTAPHGTLPDARIVLVLDQLGAGNEYQLRINGTRSGLRSIATNGETFTWMENDAIVNFRVEP